MLPSQCRSCSWVSGPYFPQEHHLVYSPVSNEFYAKTLDDFLFRFGFLGYALLYWYMDDIYKHDADRILEYVDQELSVSVEEPVSSPPSSSAHRQNIIHNTRGTKQPTLHVMLYRRRWRTRGTQTFRHRRRAFTLRSPGRTSGREAWTLAGERRHRRSDGRYE